MRTPMFLLIAAIILSLSACTDEQPDGPGCILPPPDKPKAAPKYCGVPKPVGLTKSEAKEGVLGYVVVRDWQLIYESKGLCERRGQRMVRKRVSVPVLVVKHQGKTHRWPVRAWDSYLQDKAAFSLALKAFQKTPKAPLFVRLYEAPGSLEITANLLINVTHRQGQSQACTFHLGKFVSGPAVCGVAQDHDPELVMKEATDKAWAQVSRRLLEIEKQTRR